MAMGEKFPEFKPWLCKAAVSRALVITAEVAFIRGSKRSVARVVSGSSRTLTRPLFKRTYSPRSGGRRLEWGKRLPWPIVPRRHFGCSPGIAQ